MKDIETLLNKYFEGETTCEEERQLRRYFTGSNVPEHLQDYRPMFTYMEAENVQYRQAPTEKKKRRSTLRLLTYSLGGIAASMLILFGISGIYHHSQTPANYVIIDGKQYTDTELVQEQALAAFHDVKLSEDEVFATLFE